ISDAKPTCTVRIAVEPVTTNGQTRAFHAPRNTKIATAAALIRVTGTYSRQRTVHGPAPSTNIASSSSTGSLRNAWRRTKMPKALAANGTTSAAYVSSQPNRFTVTKLGTSSTSPATMSVPRARRNYQSRPAQRSRANAQAASIEASKTLAVVSDATTSELRE